MNTWIYDLETDNLLPDVTTIHCVGYKHNDNPVEICVGSSILPNLLQGDVIVGHNIINYDNVVIKKLFRYAPKKGAKIVDTLILSRLLCRDRASHSLESWGETFGFPKGDHSDWTQYTPEMGEYCKQDVNITTKLYNHLMEKQQ